VPLLCANPSYAATYVTSYEALCTGQRADREGYSSELASRHVDATSAGGSDHCADGCVRRVIIDIIIAATIVYLGRDHC
jgi:hypothetical protein